MVSDQMCDCIIKCNMKWEAVTLQLSLDLISNRSKQTQNNGNK